jgi:hypothetical protein
LNQWDLNPFRYPYKSAKSYALILKGVLFISMIQSLELAAMSRTGHTKKRVFKVCLRMAAILFVSSDKNDNY